MKWKELQNMDPEALRRFLDETRDRLRGWRFQAASGKLNNTRQIRKGKNTVARIFTLLKQWENI